MLSVIGSVQYAAVSASHLVAQELLAHSSLVCGTRPIDRGSYLKCFLHHFAANSGHVAELMANMQVDFRALEMLYRCVCQEFLSN
jgi:hypothetical protein